MYNVMFPALQTFADQGGNSIGLKKGPKKKILSQLCQLPKATSQIPKKIALPVEKQPENGLKIAINGQKGPTNNPKQPKFPPKVG